MFEVKLNLHASKYNRSVPVEKKSAVNLPIYLAVETTAQITSDISYKNAVYWNVKFTSNLFGMTFVFF